MSQCAGNFNCHSSLDCQFGAQPVNDIYFSSPPVGTAYVSLKARADDSKSPREWQFMVRVFRKRTTAYLLWVAVYVVAMKCDFFQVPIHFDFFLAAFVFYVFCIDLLILACEQNLRRRQLQIDDNTYVEAEWTMPRKVSDPTANSVNVKNILKAVRFGAFGIISGYMIWWIAGAQQVFIQAWKLRLKYPVVNTALIIAVLIMTAGFILAIPIGFLGWQKRPRFLQIHGDGPQPRSFVLFPIMFPIIIGLMTLFVFDFHQYQLDDVGSDASNFTSPTEVLVFNFVVVLVYTAFSIRTIEILAKRRK